MAEKCEVCGQKMELETYRGGGINYALTVILFFLNLAWYWPIFGLSVFDNSVYYFLAVSIAIVLLAQPYLMRLSWALYLYMLVKYRKGVK